MSKGGNLCNVQIGNLAMLKAGVYKPKDIISRLLFFALGKSTSMGRWSDILVISQPKTA